VSKNERIVFFDWDGTLSIGKFWNGIEENEYGLINSWLFGSNKEIVKAWMIGKYSAEDVCEKIAQGTDLDFEFIFTNLKISCQNMELISPGVLGLIDQVKQKNILVGIATDNMDTFTRFTVPSLNLNNHFDIILNSFDLKKSKRTAQKFFGKYLSEMDINPSECILIDDSEDKDGNLTKYGFRYVKIERGQLTSQLDEFTQSL
jgi:FMN phosphatase YigB (HAD superfamily)